MSQLWNVSGYSAATTAQYWGTCGSFLINGIKTALTHYAGTSDPSSGAPTTWGAAEVGTLWRYTANQNGSGDGLGAEWRIWEKTGAATYAFTTPGMRGFIKTSPNTSLLSVTATSVTAWTTMDVSGATTSATSKPVAVKLFVELQESNPGAGVFFAIRTTSVTTDAHVVRIYPQVSGISVGQQVEVELDSSQTFEYRMVASGNTSANVNMALLGYYRRA